MIAEPNVTTGVLLILNWIKSQCSGDCYGIALETDLPVYQKCGQNG